MRGDFTCDNELARRKKDSFINEVVQVVMRSKISAFRDITKHMELYGMTAEEAISAAVDELEETFELRANEVRGALARSLRDAKFDV